MTLDPAVGHPYAGGMKRRRFARSRKLPAFVLVAVAVTGACDGDDPGGVTRPVSASTASMPSTTGATTVPSSTDVPPSTIARSTSFTYPTATNVIDVHEAPGTLHEIAAQSVAVIVGEVVGVTSIGRPDLAEDEFADEYIALELRVERTMSGAGVTEVVVPWRAFNVGPDGQRRATWVVNGVPVPEVGDRLVLPLLELTPERAARLDASLSHAVGAMQGISFVDDGGSLTGRSVDSALTAIETIDDLERALQ